MDSLISIWEKIVKECETEQIQDGQHKGLIRNFLIDGFYYRETAFATKIFATEYLRTKKEVYLEKSKMALDALSKIFAEKNIIEGIDEPNWTPRGVKVRKGSIPATILLLYAIDDTTKLIEYEFKYDASTILDYLSLCYIGNGRFYHDKIDKKNKAHKYHVVNTTAMAYVFLQLSYQNGVKSFFYDNEIKKIENAILKSQRSDGFWNYIEPSIIQKAFWKTSKFLPTVGIKLYNRLLGDRSILFGDAVHHVVCCYYFLAGKSKVSQFLSVREKRHVENSWIFIKKSLKEYKQNHIIFDFSWEPKPRSLRYCNFIDSSTYFYILDFLNYLKQFGIIDQEEKQRYTNGILNHIESNLLSRDIPSIKAYEGPDEILQNIIPRPSETVFDKGFFLSNVVLERLCKKKDITFVTKNNLCFGCGACGVSCHADSISFYMTNAGRLHPKIDYKICSNCGVCYDICPSIDLNNRIVVNNGIDPFEGKVVSSYMGRTLNQKLYLNSQSGGMVTEVLSYLFDQKLIQYALVVKMDFASIPKPSYFLAKSSDELYQSQKSLYAPVDLLSALKNIKNITGNIAVVGLPCHIEGIVSLIKHKPKLYIKVKYKLGLICDGVLSNIASDYFSSFTTKKHRINYKNKEVPNYMQANVTLEFEDGERKIIESKERFLLKEIVTPPRCQLCFDKMNIYADIVFGDPWGIEKYDKVNGDSVVITRNKKGQDILNELLEKKRVFLKKVKYKTILNGQEIERRREKVFQAYETYKQLGFYVPFSFLI